MTYFDKNKSLLSSTVISDLNSKDDTDAKVFGEIAENGQLNACIQTKNKLFYVHSPKNPSSEAEQWAESIEIKNGIVFLVIGFGMGYHIEALIKRCQGFNDVEIIVVEPFKELFIHSMQKRDLSKLLSYPKLHIITASTEFGLAQWLHTVLPLEKLIFKNVNLLYIESLIYSLPVYVDSIKKIKRYINNETINRNTINRFDMTWTNNIFNNFDSVLQSRPISNLFGKFKGIPAILVSAGPSLDKNIHLLPKAKNNAVIISVATAVKSLLAHGIEPDFVFSVDPGEKQYEMLKNTELKKTWLCFDPLVYPGVLNLFTENKFVLNTSLSVRCFSMFFGNVGMIKSGPSVANFAFDFAKRIGANPIILVGQDLALEDERTHATGTIHENNRIRDTKNLVKVDGINGDKVLTRRDFFSMLSWFIKEIEQLDDDIRVIDATEGGAKIPGTEIMNLSDVLNQYINNEYSIEDMINKYAGSRISEIINIDEVKREINETVLECNAVKLFARNGYQHSAKLQALFIENKSYKNKLIKLYDRIQKSLNDIKNNIRFSAVASILLESANIRLEEAIVIANKNQHLSRDWGIGFAQGFQRYFTDIEEINKNIEPLLNNIVEKFN